MEIARYKPEFASWQQHLLLNSSLYPLLPLVYAETRKIIKKSSQVAFQVSRGNLIGLSKVLLEENFEGSYLLLISLNSDLNRGRGIHLSPMLRK